MGTSASAQPLVSIITPSYNSERYIAEMIRSIQAQTFANWELLITDDCSTDRTREIVVSFAEGDPRVKLLQLEKNSGAGIARNNSIKEARGRYIAFCDSDDLWMPEKLENQLKFITSNNYDFTFCQAEVVDTNSKLIGFNKRKPQVSFRSTLIVNYIGTSGVLYDTSKIGKFYMRDIRKRQDWILWLDILKVTKYAYCLNEPLSAWRTGDTESLSSDKGTLIKYLFSVYHDYLGYSIPMSYFMVYFLALPSTMKKKFFYRIDSIRYLASSK